MNINIIETMKQALEALHYCEALNSSVEQQKIQAITNLRAAIDAAEKQEPIGKVVVINHPDDYDEIAVQFFSPINVAINDLVFTHPAPTQPDSKREPVAYRVCVDGLWFVSPSYKNLQTELAKASVVAEIEPLYSK